MDLTPWGRVTHPCVGKLSIIGSDNGLSPFDRLQTIIWTSAGILLIEPLETHFSEILIKIHIFSFKKMYSKISSGKFRPQCVKQLKAAVTLRVWHVDSARHCTLLLILLSPRRVFRFACVDLSPLLTNNSNRYGLHVCVMARFHWASSTGLTGGSKFKLRLPVQWAVEFKIVRTEK